MPMEALNIERDDHENVYTFSFDISFCLLSSTGNQKLLFYFYFEFFCLLLSTK